MTCHMTWSDFLSLDMCNYFICMFQYSLLFVFLCLRLYVGMFVGVVCCDVVWFGAVWCGVVWCMCRLELLQRM